MVLNKSDQIYVILSLTDPLLRKMCFLVPFNDLWIAG